MKYHFRIHKESKGYWAECIELDGCITQAPTKKELLKNMEEALNLFLDEPLDSKVVMALPNKRFSGENVVEVPVDTYVAFAFKLRRTRLLHKMTQRQAADRLDMKGIYSYQKLERAKTANPELKTLVLIKKKLFPEIELDDIFLEAE